jgi:PKD repeat protein
MARKLPRSQSTLLGSALTVSLSVLTLFLLATAPIADASGAHAAALSPPKVASVTACHSPGSPGSARTGRLLGMVAPQVVRADTCGGAGTGTPSTSSPALAPNVRTLTTVPATTTTPSNPMTGGAVGQSSAAGGYSGSPPLDYHGGPVMGTTGSPGNLTVTALYWDPASTISTSYKNVIDGYITNVAADDGKLTNVYSAVAQYGVGYHVHAGTPDTATDAITDGCTPDSGAVYSDNTGYTKCVTDAQIQTELRKVLSTHGLPSDLAHSYMVLLPKGVESCADGFDNAQGGECTVSSAGGTFCAYHSNTAANAIYSDLPFPVYNSPTGFTCGSPSGINESPNGQLDADVELSAFSHELNESMTDPFGNAWFDRRGNEIADDCVGYSGALAGTVAGAQYNQTINGAHYLTQEEFSNEDYRVSKNSACIQRVDLPAASFKVTTKSPKVRHGVRFNASKSKGSIVGFAWTFGDASASGSGKRTSHVYGAPGTYAVTLTVTDSDGIHNATTVFVAVR